MYFKADLILSTENLWLNPQGEYEGCDPGTYQDHGVIESYTAPTLQELKLKIERRLNNLTRFEVVDDGENQAHLEYQCDGEHDYRTPKEDRIPFIETWSIYITRIESERLGTEFLNLIKGEQS